MKQSKTKKYLLLTITLVFILTGCESTVELVSGLTEAEANEILVILDSQNIPAAKLTVAATGGGASTLTINLKESFLSKALAILVANKLPRTKSIDFSTVYLSGGGGLIPGRSEERAKFVVGLQGEIEGMIKILPGIVQVRVVIVLPDTEAIRDIDAPPPRSTASIAIVYNPDKDKKAPISIEEIKKLISSAVEDLHMEDVTVVITPNKLLRLIPSDYRTKETKEDEKTKKDEKNDQDRQKSTESDSTAVQDSITVNLQIQNLQNDLSRSHTLIWLFAVLSIIGIGIGVFGLLRAISFRAKLSQLASLPEQIKTEAKEPPKEPSAEGKEETNK